MAYITINDLYNKIDQVNLTAMTDDFATGQVNTTIVNNILQLASDNVDALVSSTYSVPFTGTIPKKIRMAAIVFACEMLYQRRLIPTEHNPMTSEADHWRSELMLINKGLLSLDYASTRAFTPIVHKQVHNRADTNFF